MQCEDIKSSLLKRKPITAHRKLPEIFSIRHSDAIQIRPICLSILRQRRKNLYCRSIHTSKYGLTILNKAQNPLIFKTRRCSARWLIHSHCPLLTHWSTVSIPAFSRSVNAYRHHAPDSHTLTHPESYTKATLKSDHDHTILHLVHTIPHLPTPQHRVTHTPVHLALTHCFIPHILTDRYFIARSKCTSFYFK